MLLPAGGTLLAFSAYCLFLASPVIAGEAPIAVAGEGLPSDEELESGGAAVGDVLIRNENIFDISDPREDNPLFRLANRLHIKTRRSLIADLLLFRTGDPYDRRILDESARILRSKPYFYDARILPVAYRDGRVDIEVLTRDVWTLSPGVSFERKGGRNKSSIDFEESNLLGYGSRLNFARSSTPERDTNSLEFGDDHLFGTRWGASVDLSDSSDGRKRGARIERPFFALDARWSAGGSFDDEERVDTLASRGNIGGPYLVHVKSLRVFGGLSGGLRHGWARRWTLGVTRDETRFSAAPGRSGFFATPGNRLLTYPWIRFDLLQDRFDVAKNRDQIERTEDFFLGTSLGASLGYASPGLGSDRNATIFAVSLGKGFDIGRRWVLTFQAASEGRVEHGVLRNTVTGGVARAYYRPAEKWLTFALLSGDRAIRPDDDNQLFLGGDNGLRGYPAEYQHGTRRLLATLEQRYYTSWYPFRLFHVGGAVFLDAGRAYGGGYLGVPATGVLRDVGAGLRIGNARSSLGNVIHVDIAFPLDGDPSIARAQLLVETKKSF